MDSRNQAHSSKTSFMKPIYLKSKLYLIVHITAGNDSLINANHPDYLTHHVSNLKERLKSAILNVLFSLLLADETQPFRPFSWWVSRHNQPMDYWAGGLPGSRKCECGIQGSCIDPTKWCNCDSNAIGKLICFAI